MIFIPASKLKDSTEKNFFIEQVELYIKLVNDFCLKNNFKNDADENNINIQELKLIGVIENEDDISTLKLILKKNFSSFIKSVNFAVAHKSELKGLLDKLKNLQDEIQSKENRSASIGTYPEQKLHPVIFDSHENFPLENSLFAVSAYPCAAYLFSIGIYSRSAKIFLYAGR